jgi:asparagine synthase (glutamine-hydrolysing)
VLAGLSYPAQLWNPVWLAPVEPAAMGEYFDEPLTAEGLYEEAIATWNASDQPDLCSRTLEFFTGIYLQNDIFAKVDRASMMVGLESRSIFLDNDLVDFCRRLPNRWKFRRGIRKYLLRRALEGLVPADVLRRRKKGLGVPVVSWLRRLPFPELHAPLPGLRHDAFRRAWRAHQRGEVEERLLLWTWLSLSRWSGQRRPVEAVAL